MSSDFGPEARFPLPFGFADEVNRLGEILRDCEATTAPDERAFLVRKALATACAALSSFDHPALNQRIHEVFNDANRVNPQWRAAILEDAGHFEFFLNEVERNLLRVAGVDAPTTQQILDTLEDARKLLQLTPVIEPLQVIGSMARLERQVCSLKDEKIKQGTQEEKRKDTARKARIATKALGGTAVVFNASAAWIFPPLTAPGAAASITIGGVASLL